MQEGAVSQEGVYQDEGAQLRKGRGKNPSGTQGKRLVKRCACQKKRYQP